MRRFLRHVRNLFRIQPGKPALMVGLRAAVAVTVPALLLSLSGVRGAGWAGLTGLLVTLADRGGSYHARARIMGAVVLLGALAGALAAPLGGRLWLDAALLLVAICATSLVRCYGETAGMVGGQLAVIFVASLGAPALGLEGAVTRGAILLFGGVWAMVQGLLLWPLHPYRPARNGVARVYENLADVADQLAALSRLAPAPAVWAEAADRHGPIRVHIEEARETLAATRLGRADESRRGVHLLVLLEMTGPTLSMLLGLASSMEVASPDVRLRDTREKVARSCESLAALARTVATRVRHPSPRRNPPWPASPQPSLADLPLPVSGLLTRLRDYLAVADETVTALVQGRPSPRGSAGLSPRAEPRRSALGPLREILGHDSLLLRHALRAALVAVLALVVTRALGLGQAQWVVLAAIGILQPHSASTEERALQRGLGTLFGALLAAGLAGGIESRMVLLLVIAVLTATSVSLLPLNFGAFQILLTPDLLLLATLHTGDWSVALERSLGVLIACALAVAGVWFLWPTSERRRFPDAAAAMLNADGRYLRQVVSREGATDGDVAAALREFGLAMLEAEASLERLMAEYRGPPRQLQPAMALLTYARRIAAGVTALREEGAVARPPEVVEKVVHEASGALDALADSLREGQRPPLMPKLPLHRGSDDPVAGALLERVPRQLGILRRAVTRLTVAQVVQPA